MLKKNPFFVEQKVNYHVHGNLPQYPTSTSSQLIINFHILPCTCGSPKKSQGFQVTLMMEAVCTSETSVNFYVTIWRYIPRTLNFILAAVRT
jgi:hypothetical protein